MVPNVCPVPTESESEYSNEIADHDVAIPQIEAGSDEQTLQQWTVISFDDIDDGVHGEHDVSGPESGPKVYLCR